MGLLSGLQRGVALLLLIATHFNKILESSKIKLALLPKPAVVSNGWSQEKVNFLYYFE